MKLDLHIHSTYSDGAYTPQMLIDTAAGVGLNVMAITDHDNVLSYDIARNYVKEKGLDIEILPGVEINTIYNNEEIHILGYFMNFENSDFKQMLKDPSKCRLKKTKYFNNPLIYYSDLHPIECLFPHQNPPFFVPFPQKNIVFLRKSLPKSLHSSEKIRTFAPSKIYENFPRYK